MKTGIFAKPQDAQARRLFEALRGKISGEAYLLDLSMPPTAQIVLSADEILWNDVDLAGLDLIYVRGYAYEDPVIPEPEISDYSVWRFDYLVTQQRYSSFHSILCELERRGRTIINPPEAHLQAFTRPLLLERLRLQGFAVPRLVTTNEAAVAREFAAGVGSVVWRTATGRCQYQRFLDRQLVALMQPAKPPVLLAEALNGPFIRGFLYDGCPLLLLEYRSPDYDKEELLELYWDVPAGAAAADLKRLGEVLGARWLQVSYVLQDGRPYLYDVETDPYYAELPALYENFLVQQLSSALAGQVPQPPPGGALEPDKPHERPAMFLRRMMDMLYEFEQSKYPKPKG